MGFSKAFQRKVRAVRLRCSVNLLLGLGGTILLVAGVIAALAVLAERLLAVPVIVPWTVWTFTGVAIGLVLLLWVLRLPSRMQASLVLDDRLRLQERFSTTLALAESEDPFARAARAESLQAVERVDVRKRFPIRLSRRWYFGAGTWALAIVLLLAMPQMDLLGFLRKQEQQQKQVRQLEEARTEVQESVRSVEAAVKQLGDPELEEQLDELDEMTKAGDPQEVKRQAIKALGDLSEKIKQMQSGAQIDAAQTLEQKLRKLRGSVDPFSQQIRMALAKGDFAQAANMLGQLQKQLAEGTLPDQKQRELAKQLQALAKELAKLAAEKEALEDELERLGLDKKLAQMNARQFKKALQQQGLTPEMIDRLMKKMAACQGACGMCAGLGAALGGSGGGAGGLSGDELADAIEQLNSLEALQQQAMLLQASLDEISRFSKCLGKGLCPGACQGPYKQGLSETSSSGSGGPGRGFGPRASDTEGETGTKTTRLDKESGEGPVIASWYFKDVQMRGTARREFSDVMQAGRQSAAEAISENQIPRRYEDAVKQYFGRLEEQGPPSQ
jgi:hypothetical protein